MKDIQSTSWKNALSETLQSQWFEELKDFVEKEYSEKTIYPPEDKIFNALELTPLDKVKAVIIGQDPYHTPKAAMGLCFSVPEGCKIPPSLVNIYKAMKADLGCEPPNHGCLQKWAENGVLLLNTVLTVEQGKANSHKNKGWEKFTDEIMRILNKQDRPIVFLLWGSPAQKKAELLDNPKHLLLKTVHPSPLSAYRGFFECGHFSKTNEFLKANGVDGIDWTL